MNKTEKQIRLCMRIMYRLIRRWYEEQGITCDDCPDDITQYGSATFGYSSAAINYSSATFGYMDKPVCSLTLKPDSFITWYEDENVR